MCMKSDSATKMDLLLPIFQLIYFVAHFLFSLSEAVRDTLCELWHFVTRLFLYQKYYVSLSRDLGLG